MRASESPTARVTRPPETDTFAVSCVPMLSQASLKDPPPPMVTLLCDVASGALMIFVCTEATFPNPVNVMLVLSRTPLPSKYALLYSRMRDGALEESGKTAYAATEDVPSSRAVSLASEPTPRNSETKAAP